MNIKNRRNKVKKGWREGRKRKIKERKIRKRRNGARKNRNGM